MWETLLIIYLIGSILSMLCVYTTVVSTNKVVVHKVMIYVLAGLFSWLFIVYVIYIIIRELMNGIF